MNDFVKSVWLLIYTMPVALVLLAEVLELITRRNIP
jgi:hypothetical protein